MASGQRSLRNIENPTHNYICVFRPSELFVDSVFKHATLPTGTIMQRGPMSISCNISVFLKMYVHKPHFTSLSIKLFV